MDARAALIHIEASCIKTVEYKERRTIWRVKQDQRRHLDICSPRVTGDTWPLLSLQSWHELHY